MHIKKYDHNYSRRHFLETVSKGAVGAGVLAPLWPLISNAQDITKAYPDELLSIEGYTKGKVSTGDCLLYTSPSPRDATLSRMPSSA